jgi:truncated hemoglobin YjbI
MNSDLKEALERARASAVRARCLVDEARHAGGPTAETARRRRELDRLEDVGRSAVLECLEAGDEALALEAAADLAAAILDEAERAARVLVKARHAVGAA